MVAKDQLKKFILLQISLHQSYPVTAPNEYHLFLTNCAPREPVTMDVGTDFYNLDDAGSVRDSFSPLWWLPEVGGIRERWLWSLVLVAAGGGMLWVNLLRSGWVCLDIN